MSIISDIKGDIRAAKKIWLPWWAVLCWGVVCALIELLLLALGRFDLALPTVNSIAVVGFAIALKRRLGRHVWFWMTMAILAALHVPLLLFVHWTTMWVPALAIAAIDSGDLILMLVILAVVERLMGGPKAA
jgi:hypothetical protein